ncbi:unnamed protein product [Polarella glacialis]|uniref:Uncharacterized protein n=1 Tax=Polarella glacialis TaxID=89957 RepID=A0A813J3L8_POLGL|nr:unnamed protein product [Polarella glacialis]CAE8666917.1 unnamed protein product [Polarella glacialis]
MLLLLVLLLLSGTREGFQGTFSASGKAFCCVFVVVFVLVAVIVVVVLVVALRLPREKERTVFASGKACFLLLLFVLSLSLLLLTVVEVDLHSCLLGHKAADMFAAVPASAFFLRRCDAIKCKPLLYPNCRSLSYA